MPPENGTSIENPSDIHKANFLAGRIERPGPAHGSPSAVTEREHGQNEPNSVDMGSTPTSEYELLQTIQHEFRLFDVLRDGKSRIVISQLDFMKSLIFDGF